MPASASRADGIWTAEPILVVSEMLRGRRREGKVGGLSLMSISFTLMCSSW